MAFRQPRRSLLTVIHQSEVGYRELLGANRTRLQPGLRWNLPILHELHRVDMREIDPNGSFPAVQTLLSAARTAE